MRPQTVEKISSVAIAVAEVMFDMAFWARRSRCKMASRMQHYGRAEFSGTDGPCAYGAILGSFLVVLGVVWCHFWSSWGLFGVPGGVLSGLGRSWEGPWWPPRPGCATWVDFWIALGAQEGAKTEPKDDQKAIVKSMQKTLACYNGLKTDLGRSWGQEGENRALA